MYLKYKKFMKTILLIGLGKYGSHVAKELGKLNVQVMAIDKSEDNLKNVEDFVTKAIIGNSSDIEFLKTIGINTYDECIVAIGDDFQCSIETVLNLKELGARRITARASLESQEKILLKIGADEVVYPEKQLARWTALHCGANSIFDYMELDDGYAIYEVGVPTKWVNKTLSELNLRREYGVTIIGVKIKGKLRFILGPDFKLIEDERMLVVGKQEDIKKCFKI